VRLQLFVIALLLSGCSYQSADAYRDIRDQVEATTGLPLLGVGPCAQAMRDEKFEPRKNVYEICYRLTDPERWRGLWRNDFEGSRFCAAPGKRCSHDRPGERIWLEYSFGLTDTKPRQWKIQPGGLYEVDFIGRRTAVKGKYGHMGGSDHLLLVDRMISIREVEAPPLPITKQDAEALWKECEAAGSCISWEKLRGAQKPKE
jgi:hypothetical protein